MTQFQRMPRNLTDVFPIVKLLPDTDTVIVALRTPPP